MSALPTRSHASIVATIAAGMQGRLAAFLNFATGGVFLAMAEAYAGVCLWLQRLVTQVQRETRLATSFGADVDSFIADFGLERLAASPSSGLVTFSRFTAGNSEALIPVNATVRTADGSLVFTVTAEPGLGSFDNARGAYVVPPNVAQIAVPVSCTTPGIVGNVTARAISLIASDVSGLDAVINAKPFTNGLDAESDRDVKTRFRLFFASLSKATVNAIRYAVASLRQGLQCEVVENQNRDGTANPGFFYAVIDDGTGAPPASILSDVFDAIDVTRAASIRFAVFPPEVVQARIDAAVTSKPGYDLPLVIDAVARALGIYVNDLTLGADLLWGRLYQIAYNAHPGVATISGLTINGAAGDLIAAARQTIRTQRVLVS